MGKTVANILTLFFHNRARSLAEQVA